jgi:hypothetical protein
MKNLFTLLLFLYGFISYSQQEKIQFQYDGAGNQIVRKLCFPCLAKNSSEPVKEISDLEQEDLQKFFPEDVISFYPNPVKEQLYLKWELNNNNSILSIKVFNMNGSTIKTYENLSNVNAQTIDFQSFPSGVYILELTDRAGKEKTIKIIKQ